MTTRRVRNKFRRLASFYLARRRVELRHGFPVISFSFDDFPKSSLHLGGKVFERLGVSGTYYVSFGLMDGVSEMVPQFTPLDSHKRMIAWAISLRAWEEPMFDERDVHDLLDQGHEVGCHTFSHCDSWKVTGPDFEASLLDNRFALERLVPTTSFATIAYPFSSCGPRAKRIAAKYFSCCRGGQQGFNSGWTDLNNLRAMALEKCHGNVTFVKDAINRNNSAAGWLIFRTHDTCEHPGRSGCTLEFLEEIVRYSVESGAKVLPVGQAWRTIREQLTKKS